ncbi:HAD family hydrolase [Thermovenabulum gondwanense]|uniref:ATPase P n=1 Tax=Thermovenabulum gondwanense TaxID=520767 RepID=A0A162MV79_9FIRM|nr:HAD family hydrolase [Thermovenabulum gondwanense]KYO67802.1 hypothetical protein ATZ99_04420 [Thermovenabulum gondwanense]
MLEVEIPGETTLNLKYLVLDYNGTLAEDGKCSKKVKELVKKLSEKMEVFILTADTYGTASEELKDIPVKFYKVDPIDGGEDKKNFVEKLGAEFVACIGNGKNDVKMIKTARLSIAVIGREGAYRESIINAQIVVFSPEDALNLLLNPKRLIATLRK